MNRSPQGNIERISETIKNNLKLHTLKNEKLAFNGQKEQIHFLGT